MAAAAPARAAARRGARGPRRSGLGESAMRVLAPRLPEILVWGGAGYAERYLDAVERVAAAAPALVAAAIHNLHRTMAIKDEVFVAYQLTSEKKYARDRERFGVDPARGDRIELRPPQPPGASTWPAGTWSSTCARATGCCAWPGGPGSRGAGCPAGTPASAPSATGTRPRWSGRWPTGA